MFFAVFKCVNSEVYYTSISIYIFQTSYTVTQSVNPTQYGNSFLSKTCKDEAEYGYQKCFVLDVVHGSFWSDANYDLTNPYPCRAVSCFTESSRARGNIWQEIIHRDWICSEVKKGKKIPSIISCREQLEDSCSTFTDVNDVILPCDGFCDAFDCSDEEYCNGFFYGMRCKKENKLIYIQPSKICDLIADCDQNEDESLCNDGIHSYNTSVCAPYNHNIPTHDRCPALTQSIPIFNFTRCTGLTI